MRKHFTELDAADKDGYEGIFELDQLSVYAWFRVPAWIVRGKCLAILMWFNDSILVPYGPSCSCCSFGVFLSGSFGWVTDGSAQGGRQVQRAFLGWFGKSHEHTVRLHCILSGKILVDELERFGLSFAHPTFDVLVHSIQLA